jgi:hypothetical protein
MEFFFIIINVVLAWACFWHASTSIRGQIFVSARIRAGSRFNRFLCFILIDVRCFRVLPKLSSTTPGGYPYSRFKTTGLEHVPRKLHSYYTRFLLRSDLKPIVRVMQFCEPFRRDCYNRHKYCGNVVQVHTVECEGSDWVLLLSEPLSCPCA